MQATIHCSQLYESVDKVAQFVCRFFNHDTGIHTPLWQGITYVIFLTQVRNHLLVNSLFFIESCSHSLFRGTQSPLKAIYFRLSCSRVLLLPPPTTCDWTILNAVSFWGVCQNVIGSLSVIQNAQYSCAVNFSNANIK